MLNKTIAILLALGLLTFYSPSAHSQVLIANPVPIEDPITDLGDEQNPDDPCC